MSANLPSYSEETDNDVLKVGIWEIGPFVIKDINGNWTGLAIEVWEHVAGELGLKYEYVPLSHHALLEKIQSGEVDVGLADIPADHHFEEYFEYSRTFFHSDLGIASRKENFAVFDNIISSLSSPFALYVIAFMAFLILFAATVYWVKEKYENEDLYNQEHRSLNFINGIMWALLLITAQENDVFKNKSFIGRFIGLFLVAVGVTVSASFIAVITSAITVNQMSTSVHGEQDLAYIQVAALSDSRAAEYLNEHHLKHIEFENMSELMEALASKQIDAVVADEVELRYYIRKHRSDDIGILPVTLETEYYAMAFPEWSTLPRLVNPIILDFIESPLWKELIQRHVGTRAKYDHR